MNRWIGKVAVVTGASAGIGAAVSVALADAGLLVVGLARRPQRVDELKSQVRGTGSLHSKRCDVSKPEEVAESFSWVEETFGGVDVLVNNAGIFVDAYLTELASPTMTDAEVSSLISTNFTGVVMCARRALASMKKRHFDGHIININSLAGHYIPLSPKFNVYPGTKYAVTAFTQSLLTELANLQSRVKVTSLSPGLVATELNVFDSEEVKKLPALKPQDVADAVLYVLSTPTTVNIAELTIEPVGEIRL